ncbi:TolC family protein [Pseudanabaenaceae cyanobacterium LEGE 13415]|nr:TolC family protein [Pseudanabaenaceae cyanobacterium LEGE 13415]
MKPSFELLALGVGVWLTVGAMGAASANPVSQDDSDSSPQNTTESRPVLTPLTLGAHRDTDGDPTPPFAIASLHRMSALSPNSSIAQAPERKPAIALTNQPTAKPAPKQTTAQRTPAQRPSAPLPTTAPPAPAPTTPTGSPPTPTNPAPAPTTPGTGGANQLVPTPAFLDPSPNRLQFPTRPGEVQIRATQPISLQQAIELAERNNRDLEVARLQVEQSRAAIREARAGNFPTLGLTANLTRSGSAFITQDTQQNSFLEQLGIDSGGSGSTRTAFSTGAQLNYDLFTSGLRPAQIQAAERRSRATELQLEQTREDVRLQVSNDYYNLQNADSQVAINEAAVRNAEANLRDSRAQETAGLGTRFDTLRAEVNLANAQQQLRNTQANQEIARRQLAQRLSLSESVSLTAADPVQPAGTWTIPLEDSIVLAYRNRAELEEQLVQREISQAQIRAVRAQNGVTLGLTAAYNFSRSGTVDTSARNSDSYSLGLQARWNLFDGGATNAQIAQQERNREIAEARFAQNRNLVRFQVEQAFANLQANLANINTTQQSVAQAEEALRLAILRFQAGVGTQTDRISAEAALTQAQGNRVSAIINYNLALAQLRRAVSNLAP